MKICIVVNKFLHHVGAGEYTYGLVKYLEKNNEVEILTPINDFDMGNVRVVKWSTSIPIIKYFLPYKTGKIEKYDVVLSVYPTITAVKTAVKISKKQRIPHLMIDMGVASPVYFKNIRAKLAHWIGIRSMRKIYCKVDKVLAISGFLQGEIDKFGVKSVVVHGGIDFKRFQRRHNTGILKKLGLKKESYALFVGRISPHKGVHFVAEALEKLGWPIKFVVVGGYPIGDYSKKLKEKKGKLIISGRLSDDEKDELCQNCMFYVTGSLWEGLNLTLIEAQACGKPVIAFDLCAHPEVIGPKSGFLVKPKDINELNDRINSLIKDEKLRKEMGEEAVKFAKKFDWDVIGKNIERECLNILK